MESWSLSLPSPSSHFPYCLFPYFPFRPSFSLCVLPLSQALRSPEIQLRSLGKCCDREPLQWVLAEPGRQTIFCALRVENDAQHDSEFTRIVISTCPVTYCMVLLRKTKWQYGVESTKEVLV